MRVVRSGGLWLFRTVEVRYARDNDPVCNLIDGDSGLPVGTFRASVEKPLADLSGDYYVNIEDLSIFWRQWLTSDLGSDINNDGIVDLGDLAIMAEQWLNNR